MSLKWVAAAGLAVVLPLGLTACSGEPDIEGVWSASDGVVKVIRSDGACTGMYYDNGRVLDIGGPESCTLGSARNDGTHILVVQQPPNRASYRVQIDGDTMRFTSGGREILLTRQ